MMSTVGDLLVAPVRSWDAIACTSRVVRDSMRVLVEEQADDLRRQMGEQARQRALAEFDWRVILGRYRALWDELAERRRADPVLTPPPSHAPDRVDPFTLFATYPTRPLTPASLVELTADSSLAKMDLLRVVE